jgi:hypothetical protein
VLRGWAACFEVQWELWPAFALWLCLTHPFDVGPISYPYWKPRSINFKRRTAGLVPILNLAKANSEGG